MISLSSVSANVEGNVIVKESTATQIYTNTARVKVVPTLDGGSVSIHSGVSDTDRPVVIKGDITKSQETKLWSMFQNEPYILMAHRTDLFLISMKSLTTDNGKLNLSIIITNKEN